MLCGTPVVASDIPGAREAVSRTGMGRLCAPGDPQALADALIEVAQQRQRYLRSREAVRSVYESRSRHRTAPRRCFERSSREAGRGADARSAWSGTTRPGNRRGVRTILEFLALTPGDRVLDCGCGLGWFLHVAAVMEPQQARLVGGIRSPAGSAVPRSSPGRPRCSSSATAFGCRFPMPPSTRRWSQEVIEHVEDDMGVLREGVARARSRRRRGHHGATPAVSVPLGSRELGPRASRVGADSGPACSAASGRTIAGCPPPTGWRPWLATPASRSLPRAPSWDTRCRSPTTSCTDAGKPLVESGLLASADRSRYASSPRLGFCIRFRWPWRS